MCIRDRIEFAKIDPIHIYHGKAGADGARGEDGYTPLIGVKKDKDGIYYWTLDGSWLVDNDGNKVRAQGLDGKDGYNCLLYTSCGIARWQQSLFGKDRYLLSGIS